MVFAIRMFLPASYGGNMEVLMERKEEASMQLTPADFSSY